MTDQTPTNRLLAEMVDLRGDLNRERWHKRALVAVAVLLAALVVLVGAGYLRLDDTTDELHDTTARLDDTVAELEAQRVATLAAVCGSDEALINTFLSLQPAPVDVVQQWQQQARLDDFEREFEEQLSALGCDLRLDPIRSPVPPASAVALSTTASTSSAAPAPAASGSAPSTFLFGIPTTTVPPSSSTGTTPPSTSPPTTSPPTTAPPPTTPNGKPYKGNGNGPPTK